MVLEIADFRTKDAGDFEIAMSELIETLAGPGYLGHSVQRSIENPLRFVLLIRWDTLESHAGFRKSDRFERWAARLKDHRDVVTSEHFLTVVDNGWSVES